MHTYLHTYIHTIYACVDTYMHTYTYNYIQACIHTYIHIQRQYSYIHAYIHTHRRLHLLQRLHLSFGVSGTLLSWLGSFLSERSMCVVHGLSRSSWVPAPYGLPQGSVLGPLLYIIYTSDIASLLTSPSHAWPALCRRCPSLPTLPCL